MSKPITDYNEILRETIEQQHQTIQQQAGELATTMQLIEEAVQFLISLPHLGTRQWECRKLIERLRKVEELK